VQEVGRDAVQQLVADGAQLVEVLPAAQYEDEHLPGAVNIPLKQLGELASQRLDPTRPVLVYCFDSL